MSLQLASGQGSSLPEISFAYNAAFTMQVWQKLDGGGSGDHRIGNTNGRFNHWGSASRWYSQAASTDRLIATTSNSNNTWTHYTLASDGSTLRLYINGVLDNSAAVNASDINYGVDFLLTQGGGTTQKISELRFYNVELSAGNISGNWDARESDGATGLVRRYPLNETSGTVLNDTQSNVTQQNGTLNTGTFDTGDNPSFAAASPVVSAPTSSAIYTNSVTLGASTDQATGQAWVVFDTSANMSGITAAQIKAGQNTNSVAAVGAATIADVSVGGSPMSAAISGLSMSTGETYTFSWVQNNANGDSNIVTSTFEVVGLEISSIDTPLIVGNSATIAVLKAGTTQGYVNITDSAGTQVAAVVTAWPTGTGDGNIQFTAPDTIANDLLPGTVTVKVENSAQNDSDTINTTLNINAGYQYHVVVSQDTNADDYIDSSPSPVAGDSVALESFLRLTSDDSVTAYPITLNPDGLTWTIPNTVPNGSYYFDYYIYDQSDDTWGAIARKTATITSLDLAPDQFDLGADATDQEPSTVIDRSFVIAGVDAGNDITVTASGAAQVSTDGTTFANSIVRQNGQTVYLRVSASATFGGSVSAGAAINGVSDSFTVTTRAASAPSITTQPANASVSVSEAYSFTVVASNAQSYQWYNAVDDSAISGATSETYGGTAVLGDDGSSFYCIATASEGGTVQTVTVTLTVVSNAGVSFASLGAAINSATHPTAASATRANETGVIVLLMNGATVVSRTTNNTTDASGIINDISLPAQTIGTNLTCFVLFANGDGVPGFTITVSDIS